MSDDKSMNIVQGTEFFGPLVVRSAVEAGLPYREYRQTLRDDFFYSCAYCTLSEYEAQGLGFEIDHYEPRSARPDLQDEYSNLMYSCDECNRLKSDLIPPDSAVQAGHRFFRPDNDNWDDHFQPAGQRINSRTHIGEFSIEALDLNRESLRRLRDIRRRLDTCDEHVSKGIAALRRFRLDQLPVAVRGRAVSAINRLSDGAEAMATKVDSVLKDAARSPLLDPDPEKEQRQQKRARSFDNLRGLYPGRWRGRTSKP